MPSPFALRTGPTSDAWDSAAAVADAIRLAQPEHPEIVSLGWRGPQSLAAPRLPGGGPVPGVSAVPVGGIASTRGKAGTTLGTCRRGITRRPVLGGRVHALV